MSLATLDLPQTSVPPPGGAAVAVSNTADRFALDRFDLQGRDTKQGSFADALKTATPDASPSPVPKAAPIPPQAAQRTAITAVSPATQPVVQAAGQAGPATATLALPAVAQGPDISALADGKPPGGKDGAGDLKTAATPDSSPQPLTQPLPVALAPVPVAVAATGSGNATAPDAAAPLSPVERFTAQTPAPALSADTGLPTAATPLTDLASAPPPPALTALSAAPPPPPPTAREAGAARPSRTASTSLTPTQGAKVAAGATPADAVLAIAAADAKPLAETASLPDVASADPQSQGLLPGGGAALPGSTDPAQPTATPPPLAGAQTTAALSAEIVRRLDQKVTRFDVQLTPGDLGRVDVAVEIDAKGQISAALSFEKGTSADALRDKAGELQAALANAGFTVAEGKLTFKIADAAPQGTGFAQNGGGEGSFGGQPQSGQQFQQQARSPAFASPSPALAFGMGTDIAGLAEHSASRTLGPRGLDIRI